MRYWTSLYRAQLQTSIASMLQYRFAILVWAVWGLVGPLISLAIWNAAAQSRGGSITNGNAVFGSADFAAYFLTYLIFGHLTMSWDAFEFAWRIRDGSLSPRLLKPVHPIHRDLCDNIAFKITTSAMLLPVWALLILLLRPSMPASPAQALLALPAVLIAAMVRYVWQYSLAVLAFWTTRVEAVNQLWFALDMLFGGGIAPLALMPAWLAAIAQWLPFRSMLAFPVELLLGRVPPQQVAVGFLQQGAWLAAGIVVLRFTWRAGIKQYSAVGA
jgi:ABC-2 type transport system permease protein